MRRRRLYLETSALNNAVPNPYGTQNPKLVAATQEFLAEVEGKFELVISDYVIEEIQCTENPNRRKDLEEFYGGRKMPVIRRTKATDLLALAIVQAEIIPPDNRQRDGIHMDAKHLAAVIRRNDIEAIVSWNYDHIASDETKGKLHTFVEKMGKRPILILTPTEVTARERLQRLEGSSGVS